MGVDIVCAFQKEKQLEEAEEIVKRVTKKQKKKRERKCEHKLKKVAMKEKKLERGRVSNINNNVS